MRESGMVLVPRRGAKPAAGSLARGRLAAGAGPWAPVRSAWRQGCGSAKRAGAQIGAAEEALGRGPRATSGWARTSLRSKSSRRAACSASTFSSRPARARARAAPYRRWRARARGSRSCTQPSGSRVRACRSESCPHDVLPRPARAADAAALAVLTPAATAQPLERPRAVRWRAGCGRSPLCTRGRALGIRTGTRTGRTRTRLAQGAQGRRTRCASLCR